MAKIYSGKICILGEPNVGKTSMFLRYLKNTFLPDYKPTLGADFIIKEEKLVSDDKFHLYLWDVAGNPAFSILRTYYLHGAIGVFICFDLNHRSSFLNSEKWLKDVHRSRGGGFSIILLGMKADLEQKVPESEILAFREKYDDIPFFKTSAKDDINIRKVFSEMVVNILPALDLT